MSISNLNDSNNIYLPSIVYTFLDLKMQSICKAYKKQTYSIETITLMHNIATNQAKLCFLTAMNCMRKGPVCSQCSGVT